MTPWRAAVSVAASLLVVLAGCGERDEFQPRSFEQIEQALVAEELQICDTRPTDGHANQAVEGREYRVAFDCGSDDDATVVVDEFSSDEARDAAARNLEVQVRPRAYGAVWTFGPFTIVVSGERDDDVEERITDALDGMGAE